MCLILSGNIIHPADFYELFTNKSIGYLTFLQRIRSIPAITKMFLLEDKEDEYYYYTDLQQYWNDYLYGMIFHYILITRDFYAYLLFLDSVVNMDFGNFFPSFPVMTMTTTTTTTTTTSDEPYQVIPGFYTNDPEYAHSLLQEHQQYWEEDESMCSQASFEESSQATQEYCDE